MAKLRYEYFVKNCLKPEASEFLRTTRQHPDVTKFLFKDKRVTREDQERWYMEYSKNLDVQIYLVVEVSTGLYIGYVTFTHESLYHRRCEVGFVVHPDHQGNGYGKAMVKWSIKRAEELEEGIHRLYLTVFPWNTDAVRLYEMAGFKKEGMMRDYVFKNDEYSNVDLMSVVF